jgi:uracil-DNA glycosylase
VPFSFCAVDVNMAQNAAMSRATKAHPTKPSDASRAFTTDCRDCKRLADFLDETRGLYPTYFCKPVPPFGVAKPRLFIVGLAPGMHGANRTGRPFTGDYAGELLYRTLHAYGFANQPQTVDADGALDSRLKLIDCVISNAVKCLPPQNKPTPDEISTCNQYLAQEIAALPKAHSVAILALGAIAHDAVLRAVGLKRSAAKFAHGARHMLPNGQLLFNSYHCSRYNTNTRRLTEPAFREVFANIRAQIDATASA